MSSLQDMWQILGRRGNFLPPDPWAAPKMPILNRVKMILVLFHGQVRVERGFNVNKDTLPNLEGMLLIIQRIIFDHLVSNDLSPQSIAVTKELRVQFTKLPVDKELTLYEEKRKKLLMQGREKLRLQQKILIS